MPAFTAAPGTPCWIDLMSSDPDRSRAFYTELLGWTCDEPDPAFGGYASFRRNGEPIAGLMARMPEGAGGPPASVPDGWSVSRSRTHLLLRRSFLIWFAEGEPLASARWMRWVLWIVCMFCACCGYSTGEKLDGGNLWSASYWRMRWSRSKT